MKGDILLGVLTRIGEGISDLANLSGAFLEAGYGASRGRIEYIAQTRGGRKERYPDDQERKKRHQYSQLIYELKKDGLISITESGSGKKVIYLSALGKKKLKRLKELKKISLPGPNYCGEKANVFTIVTFDIPESEKRKREWLREALRNLGFSFVQKSVWLGKIKLPEGFLEDIKQLGLIDFVEIFQITKAGSLRHIT
jgi:CRISPR/Cas system-associated endoribonuclease Cas2